MIDFGNVVEELLSYEVVCVNDFKTIQIQRKRCQHREIVELLEEAFKKVKEKMNS